MCEVWGWVKVVYRGVLIVKGLGRSDSRDDSCLEASWMGVFLWADMVLGILDANIYIKNDLLLRSVMMVLVVWLVLGSYEGGLGSGKA